MSNLTFNYTAAVPQGTQQINQTQVPIENNFEDIAQLIAVNHSPFNTVSVPDTTPGLHNEVTYFSQSSDPTPVANAINMYSKPVSNDPNLYELFYQYPNGTVQQLTGQNSGNGGTGGGVISNASYGLQGYQYLGGGILMRWGYLQLLLPSGASTTTYVFPFPVTTGVPNYTATPFHMEWEIFGTNLGFSIPNGYYSVLPTNSTTFTVNYNIPALTGQPHGYTISLCWMALGV